MDYCNVTTDLTDVFPDIEQFQLKDIHDTWTITSGQTYTYYTTGTGQINQMFENGVALTEKTSIATVEAAAGSWWYDSDNDILYIQPINSDDPDNYTYESGEDWDGFKSYMRYKAQQMVDAYLGQRYSTPLLPRFRKTHDASDYEYPIVRATAIYTCYLIVSRRKPGDELASNILREFYNTNPDVGEEKGLINQLLDGDISLQDQINPREAGGFNVFPGSSNDNTELHVYGKFTGAYLEKWAIEITTGGIPGTALYRASFDNGTTWDLTGQKTKPDGDNTIIHLSKGVWIEFDPGTTYTTNDKWDIDLFPANADITTGGKFTSAVTYR